MIESVCTGFVFGRRPDGTRTVSRPDCRHDQIDALTSAHQLSKCGGDPVEGVGLGEKYSAFRQITIPDDGVPRGRDDLDRRPAASHKAGEFQSVHRSGHLDIGKDHMDVRPGFENDNRLVGVASFDNIESSVCDHFRRIHADQKIIFHNKNDGTPYACTVHTAALYPRVDKRSSTLSFRPFENICQRPNTYAGGKR